MQSASAKQRITIFALFLCLLVAVFYSYDLFIRVAPSVMVPDLKDSLKISDTAVGFLSAGYFYAYVVFQIPAGIILDKYSSRWVISGAMFICMLGNFLFSIAPNIEVAMLGRVLMGVGSAFGFTGAAKIAAMWLPRRYFSWFMGFASFVGIMGGLVADTILDQLVQSMGWRDGNNVFTWIGIAVFVLMLLFIQDNKENQIESPYVPSLRQQVKYLIIIFKNYQFWLVGLIGSILFIPINVLASLWGVGFIETKLHINQSQAAHINSLLFIGSAVGFIVVSIISIYFSCYRRMLLIASALMLVLGAVLIYVPMPEWLFIVFIFLLGVSVGPEILVFEIGKCLSPKGTTATAISGINMLNNLVGAILLPVFGWLIAYVAVNPKVLSVNDYSYAMAVLPVFSLLALILCAFIPTSVRRN